MSARLQSWFPFGIQICVNGREWLSRQMDAAGMRYKRDENCFLWLEDVLEAQRLMDEQLRFQWPAELDLIARRLNPTHDEIFRQYELDYYWHVFERVVPFGGRRFDREIDNLGYAGPYLSFRVGF